MTVVNALDRAFLQAREERRSLLIPYVTAGYPTPDTFVEVALAILDSGADCLEIGIPFSDPLLDGPSIQRSQQESLNHGVGVAHCLDFAAAIHASSDKSLLFMGAFNPILAYGIARFCESAQAAGLTALIVPDLPSEEQAELRDAAQTCGLHLIQLVAPTSLAERLQRVCASASGFIYCISVAGVTGARSAGVAGTARPLVERVRACSDLPVAVGFGIAGQDQARQVAAFADAVIVGSALIDRIAAAGGDRAQICSFVRELSEAVSTKP